jgi:pimeloyl-ACP methyl ester carboxylesterase
MLGADMDTAISHVVTLVHGTFGSSSGWVKEGSALRTALRERFGAGLLVSGFSWSGANTHRARAEASSALREKLLQQQRQYPEAAHYVIGHSHGGNIALYAVGGSEVDDSLHGIVCLNTPFVCAIRRSHNQILFFLLHTLAALLVYVGIGFPAQIGLPLLRNPMFVTKPVFAAVLVFSAGCLIAAWLLLRWRSRLADWIVRRQGALIESVKLPTTRSTRVHCLWGPSDEVVGTFSLLDTLSALPYILMHPVALMLLFGAAFVLFGLYPETGMRWFGPTLIVGSPHLYDRVVGTIIIFIAFAGKALTGEYGGGWVFFGVVLSILSVVLVILAALVVALVAQTLLRLLPMGLVWYRLFDSLFVHLSFTLTPVSAERVEFRDIGTSVSVLMHSAIYNDERAIARILEIIEDRPREQGAVAA